ncbi:MAG: hypothetical protein H6774_00395 [Pseudomonadales bacterium]|nr:hypothetical protein [Pseudomonadales bacterium]
MKQSSSSWVLPAIALVIIGFLLLRWYNMRTETVAEPINFAEGVQIENLSQDELDSVAQGADDVETAPLTTPQMAEGQTDEESSQEGNMDEAAVMSGGVIRYNVEGDKVLFNVFAQAPEMTEGMYQVWLREVEGEGLKKAFTLEMGKGGWSGSAAAPTSSLPFEIVVSKEMTDDDALETVLLEGTIEKPAEMASPEATPSAE